MNIRQYLIEEFAGDLEYNPGRRMRYLLAGLTVQVAWAADSLTSVPEQLTFLIPFFALGGLGLLTKGIMLLRKSSSGWGTSATALLAKDQATTGIKNIPLAGSGSGISLANMGQWLHDFSVGPLLLTYPVASAFPRMLPYLWRTLVTGLVLFFAGAALRRTYPPLE